MLATFDGDLGEPHLEATASRQVTVVAKVVNRVRWRFVVGAVAVGSALLVSVYLGGVIAFQRQILFPRPSAAGAPTRPKEAIQVWLSSAAGRVEAWYLRPAELSAPAATIIFFHGNGELIDFLPSELAEPRRWGVGVLLVEFPGYGRSDGEPSQASLTEVALAAHDWTKTESTIDSMRIVAYGRSLGGAVAAILASKRPTAALILESTFTSVRSFAHGFGVPELAVLDPFDTLGLLASYQGPLLVLHGKDDQVVPPSHAGELARAAPRSELHLLSCGHNDCQPWSTIRTFLIRRGILAN